MNGPSERLEGRIGGGVHLTIVTVVVQVGTNIGRQAIGIRRDVIDRSRRVRDGWRVGGGVEGVELLELGR